MDVRTDNADRFRHAGAFMTKSSLWSCQNSNDGPERHEEAIMRDPRRRGWSRAGCMYVFKCKVVPARR